MTKKIQINNIPSPKNPRKRATKITSSKTLKPKYISRIRKISYTSSQKSSNSRENKLTKGLHVLVEVGAFIELVPLVQKRVVGASERDNREKSQSGEGFHDEAIFLCRSERLGRLRAIASQDDSAQGFEAQLISRDEPRASLVGMSAGQSGASWFPGVAASRL